MGAVTPLKSAPPSLKSLFEFGFAGPAFGGLLSITMFVMGLSMEPSGVGFPTALLRSSALGGGLVEYILGSGATAGESILLHPLAIAGFCGMLTNAVALLPVGSKFETNALDFSCLSDLTCGIDTDGGRIALAMFGRRGSYIVQTFTTALLCIAGIVGLDNTGWLLTYALFAAIWQREGEIPIRNEVDELDFPRGAIGIMAALVVALVLIPTQ